MIAIGVKPTALFCDIFYSFIYLIIFSWFRLDVGSATGRPGTVPVFYLCLQVSRNPVSWTGPESAEIGAEPPALPNSLPRTRDSDGMDIQPCGGLANTRSSRIGEPFET